MKYFGENYFVLATMMNIITISDFIAAFYLNDFVTRLYLLILYDGVSGIMDPTLALMKSSFIDHKIRSTVISLIRIPTNVCAIVLLYISQYISTIQICFIIVCFGIVGLVFSLNGVYLLEEFKFRKKIKDTLCVRIMTMSLINRLENKNFLLENEFKI